MYYFQNRVFVRAIEISLTLNLRKQNIHENGKNRAHQLHQIAYC